jgi:hypothetical protein
VLAPQHASPAQQLVPQVSAVAPEQTQVAAEQARPPVQAWPQVPQLVPLVWRSTHAPAQQDSPLPQAWPQAPQFPSSVCVSTQEREQHVEAAPVQAWPHAPQLFSSRFVFTQRGLPPQSVAVAVPAQTHAPEVHVASVPATPAPWHASPQVPQLPGSIVRSTHAPGEAPHAVGDVSGHSQVPALHEPPVGQRWPQAPQLPASAAWTSTQWLLQQDVPAAQTLPHRPQLAGSERPSTHRSPHWSDG